MIQPIDYNTFLATVQAEDLAMLTTFTVGVSVQAASQAEADGYYVQARRLYDAGLLATLSRNDNNMDNSTNILPWSLTALVAPVVVGYVAKLSRERILLSRNPLP